MKVRKDRARGRASAAGDMQAPVTAPTSSVSSGMAVTSTTNRARPMRQRIAPAKSRRTGTAAHSAR